MSVIDVIKEKAKTKKMHILLPEGTEPRTVQAVEKIVAQGIANVTLLGNADEIHAKAKELGVKLDGVGILDPEKSEFFADYVNQFYELRKAKGVDIEKATAQMKDPLFFACMHIKNNRADGMVAGAINSTGNTLRPGLQIIKTTPGIKNVSGAFIMDIPNKKYGENGVMIFADCAVTIDPTAEQLAESAVISARTARTLCGIAEPKVAMLSFSTKGSAKHDNVTKVVEATAMAHELDPELQLDGELQADAALVESVGQLKSPGSKVAGHANVLIFPDLQSGNIGYKLVQRLAGAEAVGPICQGFARPINDLSRGCSVEDIVSVVAITAVQAQSL